ncbi:inorganic pyrophosphatase [Candidatus Micrarchaeota archaeon]|nr:MAG: inorganic pyrophosphatase [Candidatus Micrarchaeota archaeon]
MKIKSLSAGSKAPDEVWVVVEIPKGSRNKYEMDENGMLYLDRVLHSSLVYSGDYGFVAGTKAADGDPLDALVLLEQPTFPGCILRVRPIGLVKMKDEKGEDDKIIGVLTKDPRYDEIKNVSDLPEHTVKELKDFFQNYKRLETGKSVEVLGVSGAEEAKESIKNCLVK